MENRSPDEHPFLYALASGFLFGCFTWGILHFPLWFAVVSGVGIALAVWTGHRPGGWARRIFRNGGPQSK